MEKWKANILTKDTVKAMDSKLWYSIFFESSISKASRFFMKRTGGGETARGNSVYIPKCPEFLLAMLRQVGV